MTGQAEGRLHSLALATNVIHIFELYAAVAAIFELREELWVREEIRFVDD